MHSDHVLQTLKPPSFEPQTTNQKLQTINRILQTSGPTLKTLNPEPQTPNPEPIRMQFDRTILQPPDVDQSHQGGI